MPSPTSVLVTYITNSGSTAEVANRIGGFLKSDTVEVKVSPLKQVDDLTPFDVVLIGAPMILGWHRKARRFLRKNAEPLGGKSVSLFMMAMELTEVEGGHDPRITVDSGITTPIGGDSKLTVKEKHTTVDHYTSSFLSGAKGPKIRQIGIFGGKLDYTALAFPQNLFVMLIVGARPGDKRNWNLIERWTKTTVENKEES